MDQVAAEVVERFMFLLQVFLVMLELIQVKVLRVLLLDQQMLVMGLL